MIPGWAFVEYFYFNFRSYEKLPLYLVLSVLFSTLSIWVLSFVFGYSIALIIACYLCFGAFGVLTYVQKKPKLCLDKQQVIIGTITYLLFFTALYPGIFTVHNGYYVLSSVNWQDTAMHLGIIESLAQGNFPPEAPYFAGEPLSYYYLIDFHASILVKLLGQNFARGIVYINPILAVSFAVSIWALVYKHSKNKLASGIGAYLSVFISNFMFTEFIADWLNSPNLVSALNLLKARAYTMQYQGLMEMVPMADYFLQNRPMMLALPAVSVILLLVSDFSSKKWEKRVFLAAFINVLLFKFQAFGFLVGFLVMLLGIFLNIQKDLLNRINLFIKILLIEILGFLFFMLVSGSSGNLVGLALENFSFGPWIENKDIRWFLLFAFTNFTPLFFLAVFAASGLIKTRLEPRVKKLFLFYLLILYLTPHLINFTVYKGDMFKLFYFMQIAVIILVSLVLSRLWLKKSGKIIVLALILLSTLTSSLTLVSSFLNKNSAYSKEEYAAGVWIRANTPTKSVFVSLPSVHSPITQIGGRLRLLSYITWPYTHGFYLGKDNVFWRLDQIEKFYQNPRSLGNKNFLRDMNVSYIYIGAAERSRYPKFISLLKNDPDYELVFTDGGIYVFTF